MPYDYTLRILANMIIIPMAGQSSRFKKKGYLEPKYMLPLNGKSLFDWVLLSFQIYLHSEFFLFIAPNEEKVKFFLESSIKSLGIQNFNCVYLECPTIGQAETVHKGMVHLIESNRNYALEHITIFNIDTIRPNFQFPIFHGKKAWVEVFKADGDSWSFVLPNIVEYGLVERCAEKIRLSDLACTGMYSFLNFEQFEYAYNIEMMNRSAQELFVAPIYNHLINEGQQVAWYEVALKDVLLSGVPDEYEELINRFELNGNPHAG
jgi:dTDP-glucose pyrophosphorylase